MTSLPGSEHSTRAGWLFADLTLLLAIIFLASWVAPDEQPTLPTFVSTTVTRPQEYDTCGVNAVPLELELRTVAGRDDGEIESIIYAAIDKQPESAGRTFSLALVYAGTGGDRSKSAADAAKALGEDFGYRMRSFDRFVGEQYVIANPEVSRPTGNVKLRLFLKYCD